MKNYSKGLDIRDKNLYGIGCCTDTDIIIPDGVVTICYEAFSVGKITSVVIPDSVTFIAPRAFFFCTNLKSITLGKNIISIGKEAFAYCNKLTSIELPESLTSIADMAFFDCERLTSVKIPKNVKSIGINPFCSNFGMESIEVDKENPYYDSRENCNAIVDTKTNTIIVGTKNTNIVKSIKNIGKSAFYDLNRFESLFIPEGIKKIDENAFSMRLDFEELYIPASVNKIHKKAFDNCFIGKITVDKKNKYYRSDGGALIENKNNMLINVSITDGSKYIIPDGVEIIREKLFVQGQGCYDYETIRIPKTVKKIGLDALDDYYVKIIEYNGTPEEYELIKDSLPSEAQVIYYSEDWNIKL